MADSGRHEREAIGKISRKHNKYGSTCQSQVTNETFLKHYVKTGETLQGISLKYGLTMEQIKRANNIWTNDSLFLRDYLLIPMSKSPMQESMPALTMNGSDSTKQEVITTQELRAAKLSHSHSLKSQDSVIESPESDVTARDFLSKFDSKLAEIRTSVKSLEENSSIRQDDSNPLSFLPPKKNSRYTSRVRSRSSESEDMIAEPSLVFKSKTQARKKRSSLEQLDQPEDDLFQL